jgi:hypothetical protein
MTEQGTYKLNVEDLAHYTGMTPKAPLPVTTEMDVAYVRHLLVGFLIKTRVARLAFLKPNSRNLAFLKYGWLHKIYLAFWPFPGVFTC